MRGIILICLLLGYVRGQLDFDVEPDLIGADSKTSDLAYSKKYLATTKTLAECGDCSCPSKTQCAVGVSVVTDGCGCCKICARQLGERCDSRNICDHHKGLRCDEDTGTCKAKPGRSCHVANKWYDNGALFSPTCRITCYCTDGDAACMLKCKPAPPGCRNPKRVRSSSNCCWQWRCLDKPSDFSRRSNSPAESKGSCKIQRNEWTPCSTTCGYGVSERWTNENERCQFVKEERLCIIRPCKAISTPHRKSKRSCRKTFRGDKRIRIKIGGCVSLKAYKPKYCGTCRHSSKCCQPHSTKTSDVDFRCDNADGSFRKTTKKVMIIQNCKCGRFCNTNENDIFANSIRSMRNDVYRPR